MDRPRSRGRPGFDMAGRRLPLPDAGLGIRAAASALNCDFIPLSNEQYDLVIPKIYFEGDHLQPLIRTLDNPEFRQAVQRLPGYDITVMGEERVISAS